MVVFKVLLIILVAAPVMVAAVYLYGLVAAVVRDKNREELERTKKRKAAAREAKRQSAEKTGGRS